jgi:hypothetical protein
MPRYGRVTGACSRSLLRGRVRRDHRSRTRCPRTARSRDARPMLRAAFNRHSRHPASRWRHCNFMTSSAQPSWLVWHENDIPALGSALHRIAVQGGQAAQSSGLRGSARHGTAGGAWPSLSGHGLALPVVAKQGQHRKPGIPQRCSVWPSSHSTARPAGHSLAGLGLARHSSASRA